MEVSQTLIIPQRPDPLQCWFKTLCAEDQGKFRTLNDPYRHPYGDWEMWDANLSVVTQQGKISEVVVDMADKCILMMNWPLQEQLGVDAIPGSVKMASIL